MHVICHVVKSQNKKKNHCVTERASEHKDGARNGRDGCRSLTDVTSGKIGTISISWENDAFVSHSMRYCLGSLAPVPLLTDERYICLEASLTYQRATICPLPLDKRDGKVGRYLYTVFLHRISPSYLRSPTATTI